MTVLVRMTALGCVVLLAGCGSYWTKTDATELDFGVAKGDCVQAAYADLPPVMARASVFDVPYDTNEPVRTAFVTKCLEARNWRLVERGL
jgi:uncharacterized protein YceK